MKGRADAERCSHDHRLTKFGFFGGYADGMSGVNARNKNPIYGLGYKCGSRIGGHSRSR